MPERNARHNRFIAVLLAATAGWVAAGIAASGSPERTAPTEDFSTAEAFEAMPGGDATSQSTTINREAFSQPLGNLDPVLALDFRLGNGIFRKLWVAAPAADEAGDGLGPLYNARSCQLCHLNDGRGHPPTAEQPDDSAVSMLMRLSIPPHSDAERATLASGALKVIEEPIYGGQLQDFASPGLVAEGQIEITYEELMVTLADGETVRLRQPTYSIAELGYGRLHPGTMMSPRVASQMIGLGLLEAVADEDILIHADPDDRDGDGISGRANQVLDAQTGGLALGRFGWKAGAASVRAQAADAFLNDIGISSPLFPQGHGDCTEAQAECLAGPDGNTARHGGVEVPAVLFDLTVFYSRNLAVPPRRDQDDPQVLAGKQLFYDSGCTSCHVPKFATSRDAAQAAHAGQLIWPYSDLLVHDMGEGLADGRPEGRASGREWRTAPLWGIGLTEAVSGHTYFLHDGRARTLLEAILWHDGEAASSRDNVINMSRDERQALLRFLNSL